MTKQFNSRMEAVDWIASFVENEAQFEVLREQLNFNHIYTGQFFLKLENDEEFQAEVVWLGK